MDNDFKYCECPFNKVCHEPRQYWQIRIRESYTPDKTVEDCDFYKLLKEREAQNG